MCRTISSFYGLLAATIIVVLASACKDDDVAPSKRPRLLGKTWAVTVYEMDGVDVTDERESCETDNATIFFSDGTFKDDMGSELCEEFEADVEGTWVFKANETILSIHPSGESPSDWKIVELTENRLRLSQYVQMFQAEVGVVMEPK
jgi:hypothetical protein